MTTKILLLLIALGLWFNALNPWVRPPVASAQYNPQIERSLAKIQEHVTKISQGDCWNKRICE